MKKINSALISVFSKEGIDDLCKELHRNNVKIISTGGTQKHIESLDIPVTSVESLTDYPSILGGRVKTLHPKVFGSILSRSNNHSDLEDETKYELSKIDLVIVDLYPFQKTVEATDDESEIIEKIDIGGVSLIRAAAKNFSDVTILSSKNQYKECLDYLLKNKFETDLSFRKSLAFEAFSNISEYDIHIEEFFGKSAGVYKKLRYGENPHQSAVFNGDIDDIFEKLNGKELSYNNLLDIDAGIRLISEFSLTTFAILKHNNACGISSSSNVTTSYLNAFDADPLSAFGGVLIANKKIDGDAAEKMNSLFFEIIIAPNYTDEAISILKSKKNRIILLQKRELQKKFTVKSILNGSLKQESDNIKNISDNWKVVTKIRSEKNQLRDLEFANKIVKHSKSNAIVLVKNQQMLSSGVGQTSRVDALKFAIEKAKTFKFDLAGSVMASDAFFPFPDCIEIASEAGISAVVQPGGSIKDQLSIDACDERGMAMYLSGIRHFYH